MFSSRNMCLGSTAVSMNGDPTAADVPISHSPVTLPVAAVSMTDPTAAKTFTLPTRRVRTAR